MKDKVMADLENLNKFELLTTILMATPDDLNPFGDQYAIVRNIVYLHFKYGLVPADVKYIDLYAVKNGFKIILMSTTRKGIGNYIMFVFNDNTNMMYEIDYFKFLNEEIECIIADNRIKHTL